MRRKSLVIALAALIASGAAAHAAPRAVVELFTSPFCGSCPPADELFVELARRPDLITLVMPVDSWDRPGRKDALAKPAFTDRQAAYADTRNEDTLFTPEAIINGAAPAMGSDRDEIEGAIRHTAGVLSVPVKAAALGRELVVSVGASKPAIAGGAVITVLPFVAAREIPMRGGETIRYANLVRDIVPIGTWSGKATKQKLPLQDYAQYDGIVVLLQAGTSERPGAIIGATRLRFAKPASRSASERAETQPAPVARQVLR